MTGQLKIKKIKMLGDTSQPSFNKKQMQSQSQLDRINLNRTAKLSDIYEGKQQDGRKAADQVVENIPVIES